MDNLGHDFLKQSLTILLTYLFPSSFSNFSQFPLPLFLLQRNPCHQIMPSTQTGAGEELSYFIFDHNMNRQLSEATQFISSVPQY